MGEKRWLTKEQKILLRPHADHYQVMASVVRNSTIEELEKLSNACLACTTINCGWDEYRAAQYLMSEIESEVGWRNRRDAESIEMVEPPAQPDAVVTTP